MRIGPLAPLETNVIEAPLPARYEAAIRSGIFNVLLGMTVGAAGEMNRKPTLMRWYIQKFREEHPEMQFTVRRAAKPGWSRVWRTK